MLGVNNFTTKMYMTYIAGAKLFHNNADGILLDFKTGYRQR